MLVNIHGSSWILWDSFEPQQSIQHTCHFMGDWYIYLQFTHKNQPFMYPGSQLPLKIMMVPFYDDDKTPTEKKMGETRSSQPGRTWWNAKDFQAVGSWYTTFRHTTSFFVPREDGNPWKGLPSPHQGTWTEGTDPLRAAIALRRVDFGSVKLLPHRCYFKYPS